MTTTTSRGATDAGLRPAARARRTGSARPRGRPPERRVELDEQQQAVVDHDGGPLLVLAGPGTGKTTTLVEAIVDRIEDRRRTRAGCWR